MITSIRPQGFRGLNNEDVPLRPFTVIVGPNGAGKTSILHAIDGAAQVLSGKSVVGAWNLSVFDLPRNSLAQVELSIPGFESVCWVIENTGNSLPATHIGLNFPPFNFAIRNGQIALENFAGREIPVEARNGVRGLREQLRTTGTLNLNAAAIARGTIPMTEEIALAPDGANLGAVLLDLHVRRRHTFDLIENEFKRLVPSVLSINFERAMIPSTETEVTSLGTHGSVRTYTRELAGYALRFKLKTGSGLSARQMSDGSLLTLAILTAAWASCDQDRGIFPILLIDGLEHALHPRAQAELAAAVWRASLCAPAMQVIATTHSPHVLDEILVENVVVVAPNAEGFGVAAPLSNHPDFERWKGQMKAGEFWAMVAEDWVTDSGTRQNDHT